MDFKCSFLGNYKTWLDFQPSHLVSQHNFPTPTNANPIQFLIETQKKKSAKAFEKAHPFRFNYIHNWYPPKCENSITNKSHNKMLFEQTDL